MIYFVNANKYSMAHPVSPFALREQMAKLGEPCYIYWRSENISHAKNSLIPYHHSVVVYIGVELVTLAARPSMVVLYHHELPQTRRLANHLKLNNLHFDNITRY